MAERGYDDLRYMFSSYNHPNMALRDVKEMRTNFKDLRPISKPFKYGNGQVKKLVALEGTIPMTFKGKSYNIPIIIWLHETHPYNAPMVYVQPTATMNIKTGPHVDLYGSVTIPYLTDWEQGRSNLETLVTVLCALFGEFPPVFGKPKSQPETKPQTVPTHPPAYPGRQTLPRSNSQASSSVDSTVSDFAELRQSVNIATEKTETRLRKHTKSGELPLADNSGFSISEILQEISDFSSKKPTSNVRQADCIREAEAMEMQALHLLQVASDLLARAAAIREKFND